MIDITKLNRRTRIVYSIDSNDLFISVPTGLGSILKPVLGTNYYATLYNGTKREIVLVENASGDQLFIKRAMDNTIATPFPGGSCFVVEWNPAQLCEWVNEGCVQGLRPIIDPGKYCLTCESCLTISANGTIQAVDGFIKC